MSDIYRYAGCIAGLRGLQPISRPVIDYDAVSLDGIVWRPLNELLFMIPWEDPNVH